MATTWKVLGGLAILLTVGYYTADLQRKYDELGRAFLIVEKDRKALQADNDNLRKMYTDLRSDVVKRDRP